MRAKTGLAAAFCCISVTLAAQTSDDPVAVFTEHPRLFLRPQRLRLLKRERERASPRWQQFRTLVAGNAPLPERGFAWALYFQVTGDEDFGRKAVEWALTPAADLRQQALIFDWCQDLLTDNERRDLIARLTKGIADFAGPNPASPCSATIPPPTPRRKTSTASASPGKPANPTCGLPPYRAPRNWPWWRWTSTPPKARCCKGG